MYERGTPVAAGVVSGVGRVHGFFMVIANDATVKAARSSR
jgi:acetyl-CoA carboxylase carboxyltransferase component